MYAPARGADAASWRGHGVAEPQLWRNQPVRFDENIKDYRLIASAIAPYADVLLCETMSTAEEGLAAA